MNGFRYLMLTISLGIVLAGCATDSVQTTATATKSGTAEFAEGISVGELSTFLQTSKLNAEYALFTQTVAGEETVGGVLLEGKNLSNLEDTLNESTEGFIADMASTEEKGGKFTTLLKQAKNKVGTPKITGVTGEFSQTDILKLNRDQRVSKLLLEPENSQIEPPTEKDLELQPQVSRGPGKLWVPIRGKVYLYNSAYGYQNRFVTNRMTFSGNYFAPNDGYEHDLKMNNYTGTSLPGTYFSTALSTYPKKAKSRRI